jgi:hypothetical protein
MLRASSSCVRHNVLLGCLIQHHGLAIDFDFPDSRWSRIDDLAQRVSHLRKHQAQILWVHAGLSCQLLAIHTCDDGGDVLLRAREVMVGSCVRKLPQERDGGIRQRGAPELSNQLRRRLGQEGRRRGRLTELDEASVVRLFRTTATDGKVYEIAHYNLDMAIAIGFRVRSPAAVRFRQWAADRLKEYIVKGFVLDDDRNKMHYAATGLTAAEIVQRRANATKPNMGLTSWSGGRVLKRDVGTAKNYPRRERNRHAQPHRLRDEAPAAHP